MCYILPLLSSLLLVHHIYASDSSWDYEDGLLGPSYWESLSGAELCGHAQQSPIEIDPTNLASAVNASCISPLSWSVPNATFNFSVSHNTHTIVFQNDQLSSSVSLMNSFETDSAQHSEYLLDSLHFHWGADDTAGSEHVFTGKTTTLEVHFVHYSADYASVGDAVAAWDTLSANASQDMHSLAVVGVLFEEVADNEDYDESADELLLNIAQNPQMDDVWRNATGYAYFEFAIGDLIDVDDVIEHYYVYDGSLTTPPCTPAVKWHLARNPLAVRKSTMDLFRAETKLWSDATGQIDADSNFRPTQSNPSCIWVCSDDETLKWCPAEDDEIDYGEQWHYEDSLSNGPSTWADFSPLCGHEQQSPILIDPTVFDDEDSCASPLEWSVPDTSYAWTITHKGEHGHTLNVYNGESQNDVVLDNVMSENGQHEQFKLYSFHFHWGPGDQNGSEHMFEGTTTTFEVHFVHYSTDYSAVGDAVGAWDTLSEDDSQDMHTLGVVGVLFEEVGDSEEYNTVADSVLLQFVTDSEMDELWNNVTDEAHLTFAIGDLINVTDVKSHYYLYQGSLTTPPCTPAVRWHLAQNTIKVRGSTMDLFRAKAQIWSSAHHNADSNFRPVQSNPNCVYTCADNAWCPGLDYPDWHYETDLEDGPSNWADIEGGELCDHEQQSPILIDPEWFTDEATCETPLDWHVEDTQYNWTVTHKGESGHTLSVYSSAAKADTYLYNAFGTNGDQHEKYKFYSLHFHWGKGNQNGSEHVFEGTTSTFEVHFVHYSSDYEAVGDAVAAWDTLSESSSQDMHTLGVAGFLFEEVGDADEYNTAADAVLLQFAEDASMSDVWANGTGSALLTFAITDLVDVEDFESENYHYWGSLTTPPCTPAVSWHLARNTIKVRGSTMDTFRARTKEWTTSSGYVNADQNFRPVQSNPSCVSACGEDYCPSDDIEYPEWHYEDDLEDGPSNWANIEGGELCDHEQQSPISIDPTIMDDFFACDTPLDWHVEETTYDWTVTHKGESGHTLSVYSADAKHDTYLNNSFGTNGDQHEKYKFYALHFHWGKGNQNGSEHVYDGVTTTFEVHFVHYSSDYEAVGDAVGAWDALSENSTQDMHTLGVVGFLFEEVSGTDRYHTAADAVLRDMATNDDMSEVWAHGTGSAQISFAIRDLVDVEDFESRYYHYWGSLTTPPCTPAVSWHLAQNTIKVRSSTMELFRARTKEWTTSDGFVNADQNFRPVQSNPSCVAKCSAGEDEDVEWCPEETDDDESVFTEEESQALWIIIGVVVGLVLLAALVYFAKNSKERKERNARVIRDGTQQEMTTNVDTRERLGTESVAGALDQ